MKLLDEKEVEETAKSDRWFESIGTPSSDYQLGFKLGSNWSESKLIQLMLEFTEWIADNKYTLSWHKEWINERGYNTNKTTKELLEQFIKTKKK